MKKVFTHLHATISTAVILRAIIQQVRKDVKLRFDALSRHLRDDVKLRSFTARRNVRDVLKL